jgi:sugar lactone lactonase YvrE
MKRTALCCLVHCTLSWVPLASAQTGSYAFTTVAGLAGASGGADGTNAAARFNFPGGVTVDSSGNLYVADILNHTIRKVTPAGTNWVVTTLAGLAGTPGATDGTNTEAFFDRPNGAAFDHAGNLFVADKYNHTIRKVTSAGTNWIVTTIAGLAGSHGSVDGTNSAARFWSPTDVAVDNNDNVYVVDNANFTVRLVAPSGTNWVVTTIAGSAWPTPNPGFSDGTNSDAQFNYPIGIAIDGAGRLYIADWGNNAIRQIVPLNNNWIVTTIAGASGVMGSDDGPGFLATFNSPNSLCVDHAGALYVTDQFNDTIRQLIPTGSTWMVSTLAGLALQRGAYDGIGGNARFNRPFGIAVNSAGDLYVADWGNQTIRKGVFVPSLQILLAAQHIVLSWPFAAAGYAPEISSSLEPGATWSPLTNAPTTNGPNIILSDQLGPGAAFYRLRKR